MPSRRDLLRMDFGTPAAVADHWIRLQRPAMACGFTILLSGEDAHHVPAARDELDEVERIEAALTVFRETSDLVRLNRHAALAPVAASPELFALLALCRDLHQETEGAFDITSTPLSRCWGFLAREGRLPATEDIEAARALVGMEAVVLDASRRTVRFQRPTSIPNSTRQTRNAVRPHGDGRKSNRTIPRSSSIRRTTRRGRRASPSPGG